MTVDLTDPQLVPLDEVRHLLPPITGIILRRLARTDERVVLGVARPGTAQASRGSVIP